MPPRIYLSPPEVGAEERRLLLDAFDSNWIAPLGPHVDAFEREFAAAVGAPHAVALSSGTAALHLALHGLGVGRGQIVVTSTLTFAATAFAITYLGAIPAFVDCARDTWTMDTGLLEDELSKRRRDGQAVAAVVSVDLYGQPCDYDQLTELCRSFGVPLVADAAEALGSTYKGRPTGTFGACTAFSFNGNKIITTSGGGMLVSSNRQLIERARYFATQARQPAPHYEHTEIGFNYRMSNVLAALGRGQLLSLAERVAARRRIFQRYAHTLGQLPGVAFMPEILSGASNRWLTSLTLDSTAFGATREDVRLALEAENIESRPVWKPMHLQPVFAGCSMRGGAVSEDIFARGLCLPSGSGLSDEEQDRIIAIVASVCRRLDCGETQG